MEQEIMEVTKRLIFKEGRLLERKMFLTAFANMDIEGFIYALKAYENLDGGFGSGLEPDLLTPSSTGIAVETALTLMDLMKVTDDYILMNIVSWVENRVDKQGIIHHPPRDLSKFPYEPWWEFPDDKRILSIMAYLEKFDFLVEPEVVKRVDDYAMTYVLPEKIEIYDYPIFIYALYKKKFENREKVLDYFYNQAGRFLKDNQKHFPLYSRYWYHFISHFSKPTVEEEWSYFEELIEEDGGIKNPYPQLKHWKSIMTLDGLLIRKNIP